MKRLFYLIVFWPTTLVHAQHCRIAGQIFFADVVDRTIMIKTDSDDVVNFNYDNAMSFRRSNSSADRIAPEELNNGDRLCVGTSEPVVVTITRRTQINSEQKKELAAWQADSLYGVVSPLDRKAGRITLMVSTGDKPTSDSVDVIPNAAYWFFPRDAVGLSDAVAGSLDRISSGDTIYVRGTKGGVSQTFVASLIVSGGLRSFAATIEPTGPLDDLQPGDTVLILGIDEGDGSLRALIAGFSPFGVLPSDPSQQMRWIFDNVALGDAYPATP